MIIKYKACLGKIEKVEVKRETEKMVVITSSLGTDRKESKDTDWYCYRDTFEEAKGWIIDKELSEVNRLELRLKVANDKLQEAFELSE